MNNVKEFLKEYDALTKKHGMYIGPKLRYRPGYRVAALEVVIRHSMAPIERVEITPVLKEGEWITGVADEK